MKRSLNAVEIRDNTSHLTCKLSNITGDLSVLDNLSNVRGNLSFRNAELTLSSGDLSVRGDIDNIRGNFSFITSNLTFTTDDLTKDKREITCIISKIDDCEMTEEEMAESLSLCHSANKLIKL